MTFNFEAVEKLFRNGDFLTLVRESGHIKRETLEPQQRAIIANALALVGQLEASEKLAELDRHSPSSLGVRSQAESTLCVIRRREGNHPEALRHAQAAVLLAEESQDMHRLAWALLHLFRLLIEIGSVDKALASLTETRKAVTRAGSNDAASYLHVCVSMMEGRAGRLDEARRHCDIAEGLLKGSSNLWLPASGLLNRGCIAAVACDFDEARAFLRLAREIASKIGYVYVVQAVDASLGWVELLTGRFERAEETLALVSKDHSNVAARLGALECLARVYVASGRLDEAERVLFDIKDWIGPAEHTASIYDVRWAAITQARLLMYRGLDDEASNLLKVTEDRFRAHGDIALTAAIHLTQTQAAIRRNAHTEASRRLAHASESGVTGIPELQGEYYYVCALSLSSSPDLAKQLRQRAARIWASQGVVSVRREIDNTLSIPATTEDSTETPFVAGTVECVTNALAALNDVAQRPRLLAKEMVAVIQALECSPDTKIVESRTVDSLKPSDTKAVVHLGTEGRKYVSLICSLPQEPVKAVMLGDVLRMGRAAVELERARREERNRAAVWPESPIEQQAGALFVADEMQTLLATARRIATTNVPVLITGETGTGKEVLARTIHAYSARASATFLPFNCSSVPRDMLDSQLFGHRRGSFTGASENFPGVIRAASGGTLFLDEIGETTLEVQPKLLRFLDSNEVHPIGETQPVKADVRVIAATNVDLDRAVAEGRFREDLFYRLNIMRFPIPPLRERRVEIPALAMHYLQKHAHEYHKGQLRLAEETMEYLLLYRWPGNVRQLANEMRRMAALAEVDAVLMPEHLTADIAASRRTLPASQRLLDPTEVVVRIDQPMPAAVQHLESTMIQYAMRASGGKVEDAATLLGLSRKGLYLKRLRYGLVPSDEASTEVA